MNLPRNPSAHDILVSLSGVRVGTLPIRLAGRLAAACTLHAGVDKLGAERVCEHCGMPDPCPTRRIVLGLDE